jgi:outer membrane protein assembly factor BamD (BamD/ComL family)
MVLPQAEATPELLHEAAKTAGYIRAFPKALDLYQWVYDRYPEHSKAGQSLFMMAFTYENEMKDAEKAKSLYEQFLAEYPGNDFADDAKFLLENLGKSDEEIIKSFGGN